MPNIKKLNHQQFIELCLTKGINISKITRQNIHIIDADGNGEILPNCRPDLYNKPIFKFWKRDNGTTTLPGTLLDAIQRGNKIEAIVIIRNHTQIGLKDTKDLYEANEMRWRELYGTRMAP